MGALLSHFKAVFLAEVTKSCRLDLSDRWFFDGPVKEFNFGVFAGGTGAFFYRRLNHDGLEEIRYVLAAGLEAGVGPSFDSANKTS